jgi:phosphotransferase family enzyme
LPKAKLSKSAEVTSFARERVAATLGVSADCVDIGRWKFSGESPSLLHCVAVSRNRRLFAKIFLVDPYPILPRILVPWDGNSSRSLEQYRPVDDQIDAEWSTTSELQVLADPSYIPIPVAKSQLHKTIVWEEVKGVRVDRLVERSRWLDPTGKNVATALSQAGNWLRKIHDNSQRGTESVTQAMICEAIHKLTDTKEKSSSRYADIACRLIESALQAMGGQETMHLPIALCHGDFLPANLMWDDNRWQLSIFDFEHCGYRNIFHDLLAMIFSLRLKLLNPLIPKRVILSAEKFFWAGYGPVANNLSVLVGAVASSRIFYHSLPRLTTRRERRGTIAGINASVYKMLFEDFLISRRFGVSS